MIDTNTATETLAAQLHDSWRATRKLAEGTYDPKMKPTTDAAWSDANGGATEVDIANTAFPDLPADWQAENRAAADSAVKRALAAASGTHVDWMGRNPSAPHNEAQHVDFGNLTAEDQKKDLMNIRDAAILLAA